MLLAFYAVTNEYGLEGVNGLAVDSTNERLFTGDTLGNVRVWDIAFTCLDGVETEKPRMIREWYGNFDSISNHFCVAHRNTTPLNATLPAPCGVFY